MTWPTPVVCVSTWTVAASTRPLTLTLPMFQPDGIVGLTLPLTSTMPVCTTGGAVERGVVGGPTATTGNSVAASCRSCRATSTVAVG